MSRHQDRAAARPLPPGLRICDHCGEARGSTPGGRVAACFCSGVICNRCGERRHRPITDLYDLCRGVWVHIPYFALMAHTCNLAPGEAPHGTGWTHLQPDPEVLAHPVEASSQALAETEAWVVLDLIEAARSVGHVRPARPN